MLTLRPTWPGFKKLAVKQYLWHLFIVLNFSTDKQKETLFQLRSLEALEKMIDKIRRAVGKQKLWHILPWAQVLNQASRKG